MQGKESSAESEIFCTAEIGLLFSVQGGRTDLGDGVCDADSQPCCLLVR